MRDEEVGMVWKFTLCRRMQQVPLATEEDKMM